MERLARHHGGLLGGPLLENGLTERVGDHQAVVPQMPTARGDISQVRHDHDPGEGVVHPAAVITPRGLFTPDPLLVPSSLVVKDAPGPRTVLLWFDHDGCRHPHAQAHFFLDAEGPAGLL